MLYIICVIISIVAIILAWYLDSKDCNLGALIAGIVAVPAIFAAIMMTILLLLNYITVPKTEAILQETYQSLNTRIENHMYSDEDRNNLIEAVQEWNNTFAGQEKSHNNFWSGIFYPSSVKGLDKIDLERIK